MLNIHICEDNIDQLNNIRNIIEDLIVTKSFDMQVALSTQSGDELLKSIKNRNSKEYGVYFLDVELNSEMNGIELGGEIRRYDPRAYIVYISIHPELLALTFKYKVEALDYISKNSSELKESIFQCLKNINGKHIIDTRTKKKGIFIKSGDKDFCFNYEDILYFETSSNPHRIILYTYTQRVEFYDSLSDIAKRLDNRFLRCDRSIILNIDKISNVERSTKKVTLDNNQTVFISTKGIKMIVNN